MDNTPFHLFRHRVDARTSIKMAEAAYEDRPLDDRYELFQGAFDGQVILQDSGGRVMIAFRGTESVSDWIRNAMRYRTGFPHMNMNGGSSSVHAGFLSQYSGMRRRVIDYVRASDASKVLITGHSLGGALATLCAADIAHQFADKTIDCYAYSSPRVGDRRFVNYVEHQTNLTVLRIRVPGDVVTSLPYFGFVHTRGVTSVPLPKSMSSWCGNLRKRHSLRFIADRMYS